jgi:hypothetical protein
MSIQLKRKRQWFEMNKNENKSPEIDYLVKKKRAIELKMRNLLEFTNIHPTRYILQKYVREEEIIKEQMLARGTESIFQNHELST